MLMGNTWNDDAAKFAPSFTINSSQQPCQQRARVGTPYVKARGRIILSARGRLGTQARMPSSESTAITGHVEDVVRQPNPQFTSTPRPHQPRSAG
jgi:hypothetical protein